MPFRRNKFKSTIIFLLLLTTVACREGEKPAAPGASSAVATPSPASDRVGDDRPIILAFGDSLTAGYGLSPAESYPTLLQARLDQRGYRYRVVNAGVSGDTTAGGRRRLDWSLEGPVRIMILALGGNDGLRGQPVTEMKANLAGMIELAQGRGVKVVLAGMEAPPNLGPEYTREFRAAYRDLARQYRTPLIPFLLEGVGGRPDLNQPDGIHPNVEGEKLLLENVWRVIETQLEP
jgi:acyl-CoA thioesterase-1